MTIREMMTMMGMMEVDGMGDGIMEEMEVGMVEDMELEMDGGQQLGLDGIKLWWIPLQEATKEEMKDGMGGIATQRIQRLEEELAIIQ